MSKFQNLSTYKPNQLVLVKYKVGDKDQWPAVVERYDLDTNSVVVKWLYKTTEMYVDDSRYVSFLIPLMLRVVARNLLLLGVSFCHNNNISVVL